MTNDVLRPRSSSNILYRASYFQLSSWCLECGQTGSFVSEMTSRSYSTAVFEKLHFELLIHRTSHRQTCLPKRLNYNMKKAYFVA